jgi:hypothetical protein
VRYDTTAAVERATREAAGREVDNATGADGAVVRECAVCQRKSAKLRSGLEVSRHVQNGQLLGVIVDKVASGSPGEYVYNQYGVRYALRSGKHIITHVNDEFVDDESEFELLIVGSGDRVTLRTISLATGLQGQYRMWLW